jgi:hypothetical protein
MVDQLRRPAGGGHSSRHNLDDAAPEYRPPASVEAGINQLAGNQPGGVRAVIRSSLNRIVVTSAFPNSGMARLPRASWIRCSASRLGNEWDGPDPDVGFLSCFGPTESVGDHSLRKSEADEKYKKGRSTMQSFSFAAVWRFKRPRP